jgi:hypothetical protein
VSCLSREPYGPALVDPDGEVLGHLGVDVAAQYLVRPDARVAFRAGGSELRGLTEYLAEFVVAQNR